MSRLSTLTEAEVQHFLDHGYVVIHDAMPKDFLEAQQRRIWVRLGYQPDNPSTWERDYLFMEDRDRWDVETLAPRVWGAAVDLVGGEDRIQKPFMWSDGFKVNMGLRSDEPWQEPSHKSPGWHKDGDPFRHFLDSPEQAVGTMVLWTDVRSRGGATFIVPDSPGAMARYHAAHPEGVMQETLQRDYAEILTGCSRFEEVTGKAGDVYLLHPFMLHATAPNTLRLPRVITNHYVHLKEPMRFDRPDGDYSVVERSILRGLGVESYPFVPTHRRDDVKLGAREAKVRENHDDLSARRQAEEDRLTEAGLPLHWPVATPV